MARGFSQQELLNLARAGAAARIAQLEEEIARIRATFGRGAAPRRARSGGAAAAQTEAPRKRRRMSAAGRKRIADAAKRRWAKWRSEQKAK